MNLKELNKRANACELCGNDEDLHPFVVAPRDELILTCTTCLAQMENHKPLDTNHWRCLNDCMWSTVPAVQVVSWRMLTKLKDQGWTQDLLDIMYLKEDTLEWAKTTGAQTQEDENVTIHKDANGNKLAHGDSVVLLKDLDVKGANFTAKRGEFMRNITLVHDNEDHIEGRMKGQKVVILTKYVKKSN